jgi:hypothetical protein
MITINSVVSELRSNLKDFSRTSDYSNEFLIECFLNERALLIEQKLKKFQKMSDANYQSFCLDLQLVNQNDCSELDCPVKRTVFKIPATLTGRNRTTLEIFNLANVPISEVAYSDINNLKLNAFKKDKVAYFIKNDFIYIINDLKIAHIYVRAIFENPIDFLDIQSGTNCVDVYESDLKIEYAMKASAIQMVLEKILKQSYPLVNDTSNNSNESN